MVKLSFREQSKASDKLGYVHGFGVRVGPVGLPASLESPPTSDFDVVAMCLTMSPDTKKG